MSTDRNGCTEIQAQIPLYAGGDLESPLAEGVAEHLRACRACSEELARLGRALQPLRELGRDQVPASFDVWPGVRATLEREGRLVRAVLREGSHELRDPAAGARVSSIDPAARPAPARGKLLRRFGSLGFGSLGFGSLAAAAAIVAFAWIQWRSDDSRPVPGTGTPGESISTPQAPSSLAFEAATSEPPILVAPILVADEGAADSSVVDPRLATSADPLAPAASGRLRRAGPDEERMRDFASPYLISPAREGPSATFVGYDRGIR